MQLALGMEILIKLSVRPKDRNDMRFPVVISS